MTGNNQKKWYSRITASLFRNGCWNYQDYKNVIEANIHNAMEASRGKSILRNAGIRAKSIAARLRHICAQATRSEFNDVTSKRFEIFFLSLT